jgi:hypothetical protein
MGISHASRIAELAARKREVAEAMLRWTDKPNLTMEGRREIQRFELELFVLDDIADHIRFLERRRIEKCNRQSQKNQQNITEMCHPSAAILA